MNVWKKGLLFFSVLGCFCLSLSGCQTHKEAAKESSTQIEMTEDDVIDIPAESTQISKDILYNNPAGAEWEYVWGIKGTIIEDPEFDDMDQTIVQVKTDDGHYLAIAYEKGDYSLKKGDAVTIKGEVSGVITRDNGQRIPLVDDLTLEKQ